MYGSDGGLPERARQQAEYGITRVACRQPGKGGRGRNQYPDLGTNPSQVLLNVSPATYFGIWRQQKQAGIEGTPARFADPGIRMSQSPHTGAYGAGLPAGDHPGIGIPNRGYVDPGQPTIRMPDAQQRKLAL